MRYRILAFGGVGSSVINSLILENFDKEKLFYFDTDQQSILHSSLSNKFLLGRDIHRGVGASGRTSVARESFKQSIDLIRSLISVDILYIIVGGLGGGTFTGVVGELSKLLSESNRKFIIVASFPFSFEGKKRENLSRESVKEINHYTDKLLLLHNAMSESSIGNSTIEDIFRETEGKIVQIIKQVISEMGQSVDFKELTFSDQILEILEKVKAWINSNEYLIVAEDSKIILPNTNYQLLQAFKVNPNFVHSISPRKFEELIEYIYKLAGLETELTATSRDRGIDLLVWTPPPILGNRFLTVIQAKKYASRNKVGEPEVRELLGSQIIFKADKAQMVTSSDYSLPAIKTARDNKIDLIKFYELTDTIKNLINDYDEDNSIAK